MIHHTSEHFEPRKYQFSAQRQFHALKHFRHIDNEFLVDLACRCAMSESEILKRTEAFGSKFKPAFATNPLSAIKRAESGKGYVMEYRTKRDDRIEVRFVFDDELYPEGIGFDSLVKKKDPHVTNPISQKIRNGFPIMYTKGSPSLTWEMNLVFGLFEYTYHLITLFPGKYSPAFPDTRKQSAEEFKEISQFWNEHVFLI